MQLSSFYHTLSQFQPSSTSEIQTDFYQDLLTRDPESAKRYLIVSRQIDRLTPAQQTRRQRKLPRHKPFRRLSLRQLRIDRTTFKDFLDQPIVELLRRQSHLTARDLACRIGVSCSSADVQIVCKNLSDRGVVGRARERFGAPYQYFLKEQKPIEIGDRVQENVGSPSRQKRGRVINIQWHRILKRPTPVVLWESGHFSFAVEVSLIQLPD